MADISIETGRSVNPLYVEKAEIYDFVQAETLAVGDVVYLNTAGKVGKADADAAGKLQARGIVVHKIGNTVSIMKKGWLAGFDLSGVAYDGILYLSNTAGKMADAGGGTTVICGRVSSIPDNPLTKVLYVDFDWVRTWA